MASPDRKYTLSDAMILIGFLACGLAWSRAVASERGSYETFSSRSLRSASEAGVPCVAAVAAGLLAIQLRPPRPQLCLLANRLGASACGAVVLSIAFEGLAVVGFLLLRTLAGRSHVPATMCWLLPTLYLRNAGVAVAGIWLGVALSGRYSAETCWAGRAGIVLGSSLVVNYVAMNILATLGG